MTNLDERANRIAMDLRAAYAMTPAAADAIQSALLCFAAECLKKNPWVGLTEEEATALWEGTDDRDSFELLKRVEKTLKWKNT